MTDLHEPRRRALLPFLDLKRHGNRSHTTCFYKCGIACDSAIPNQTDNPTFSDVVQTAFSRRNMLKAAGVEKGSGEPHVKKVASITMDQVRQIAQTKMRDLNATDIDAAAGVTVRP